MTQEAIKKTRREAGLERDAVHRIFTQIKSEYRHFSDLMDRFPESTPPQMQQYSFYDFLIGFAAHLDNPEFHLVNPELHIQRMTGKKIGRDNAIRIKALAKKITSFKNATQGVIFHPEKTKRDRRENKYRNTV